MAAVFESDGYSIDIEAVKDQLRILGHEVADDVIVNFIKQVYLPQRTSQAGVAHSVDLSSPGGHPIDGATNASSSRTSTIRAQPSTSDSLALADAIEYDDNVVVATEEDLPTRKYAGPSSFPDMPSKPKAAPTAPIDVRGDSASDWNDDFGLKSLKLSASTRGTAVQEHTASAHGSQQEKTTYSQQPAAVVSHPCDPRPTTMPHSKPEYQQATLEAHPPSQATTWAPRPPSHTATSDTSPTRDTQTTSRPPSSHTNPSTHPAPSSSHTQSAGLHPSFQNISQPASLPTHADPPRPPTFDPPQHATDPYAPSHNTYSFALNPPPPLTHATPPTRHAPPSYPASEPLLSPPSTSSAPARSEVHPHSYLADLTAPQHLGHSLPAHRLPTTFTASVLHPPPPPAGSAPLPRPTARQLLAESGLRLGQEGSVGSFSARSSSSRTSSVSTASGGRKKVDRVNRYHQLAAGWEKDRFLKRHEARPKQPMNFHNYFASLHAAEEQQQQQRKQAALDKTRRALAPAASYQVPTEKRRDSLRWEVRMQMRRQDADSLEA